MKVTEKAYAKLNLSLDVGKKRPDGFHEMVMVMQTVSLCDTISIETVEEPGITASSNLSYIPTDGKNLAVKAALKYRAAAGTEDGPGLKISMRKSIPVGAGMGGGSSDAAAVLRALNRMDGDRFSRAELEEIAAGVGSDVAFCVAGGTMLAEGRGEILRDLPALPECSIVICKPEFSISTPELFTKLDRVRLKRHPDTAGILAALDSGDLGGLCRRMYNVFEDVEDRRLRTVGHIKSVLLDYGAMGAIMTGTGSAVFGIFTAPEAAEQACNELKKGYRFCCTARPQAAVL